MVYPGAVHTRFEHSLGVYWLAGETINKIAKYQVGICLNGVQILNVDRMTVIVYVFHTLSSQGSELDIDRNDMKTVKLAGNQTVLSHYALHQVI